MNQVHKETLAQVENALEGREGLDVEIFGMEGIPEDALLQHHQQIIDDFHKNRADRQAATGNPPPGQRGSQRGPLKKIKMETAEELKARLAVWRAQAETRKKAEAAAAAAAAAEAEKARQGLLQQQQHQQRPPALGGMGGMGGMGGLPQRPGGAPPPLGASTLDDLVSGASHAGPGSGDDIDRLIRMAEAGVRPGAPLAAAPPPAAAAAAAAPPAAPENSSKKDKATRMVYQDGDYSLEEKMAQMARYAVAV